MVWCLAATLACMVACSFLPAATLPALAPLALAAVVAALAFTAGPVRSLLVGAALALGISVLHASQALSARLPAICEGRELAIEGYVGTPIQRRSQEDRDWVSLELIAERVYPSACAGIRRLRLADGDARPYRAGERWRVHASLRDARGLSNPGARLGDGRLARAGIDARGTIRRAERLDTGPPWWLVHQRVREKLVLAIAGAAGASQGVALLRAITVGDGTGIAAETWERLRSLGIVHLFVISGLHVSLIAALGTLAGRFLDLLLGFARAGACCAWLAPVIAVLTAGAYAALAGFTLPAVRAFVMLACFCLAAVAGRPVSSWRNLLMAMTLVTITQPLAPTGSGFWLSGGAVLALLWFGRWRRPSGIRGALALHSYMALAMAPLTAWFFAAASLIAPLANFCVLPLVSLFVVPAALAGVLLKPLAPSLADWLWVSLARGADLCLEALDLVPEAVFHLVLPGIPASALTCLALALFAALCAVPIAPGARALSLLLLLPVLAPDRSIGTASARLEVLDVGQGSAALLLQENSTILFDTGGGNPEDFTLAAAVIAPVLRREGVRKLDLMLVSHADLDHSAGAAQVMRDFAPERRILGEALPGIAGEPCRPGQVIEAGAAVLTLLSAPPRDGIAGNAASCAVLVEVGGARVLLPGDIDREREQDLVRYWGDRLEADVLLLAHHGSNSSSSTAFLKTVRPQLAITSAGYRNPFRHPHPSVLERLARLGIDHLRTDQHGALTIEFPGSGVLAVRDARGPPLPYWQRPSPDAPRCAVYTARSGRGGSTRPCGSW